MTRDPSYVVRLACPEDVAFLPSVERRAASLFANHLAETGLTLEDLDRVTSLDTFAAAQASNQLWVADAAEPDGEPVGFALVRSVGGAAHLDELDVVPEHSRKGLGSRLLAAVCTWARDAGYQQVTLSTFRSVPWNAPFYARHGFVIVDPVSLSERHVQLVEDEKARGLRADLRVVMACRTDRC